MSKPILEIEQLKVFYPVKVKSEKKIFGTGKQYIKAINGISFHVNENQTFGIVGESGCGKSTTGKAIVRLLEPTDGNILFQGKDINTEINPKELSDKISIVFQDPYSSLDPRFTVGRSIEEPMIIKGGISKSQRKERAISIMKDVGLRPDQYTKYPHEFSGGQRQRIVIARALVMNPKLVVCDEPVSALDVSVQAQILNMMKELQKKHNLTYIFISHDLSVVKHICDYIAVMYFGKIIEMASKEDLFNSPTHPYTQTLLDAIPIPDPNAKRNRKPISSDVPSTLDLPKGCPFNTRCPRVGKKCYEEKPELIEISPGHFVSCHYV